MDAELSDALVFFGATGDLAYKKIFPALQALVRRGELRGVPVVGVAYSGWSLEQLRARARASVQAHGGLDEQAFASLCAQLRYVDGDYCDPATFPRVREALGAARRPLYYLAIPPSLFAEVVQGLAHSGCMRGARVVVEKPFGHDLASARALNAVLRGVLPEQALFRIDHYLGEEAVQNLLFFRFANSLLEHIWDRRHVARIEVTMAEAFGVEGRGRFYEETGALRDVVQNHLLQVVALLTMDAPCGGSPDRLRDERARVFHAMRALGPADVVRGQYRGYREEPNVAPDSTVETYVALRLCVDSWRWQGVPIHIRAGKRLPVTATEVRVELQRPPHPVFEPQQPHAPNYVRFRLGPRSSIGLGARTKRPGEAMVGEDVELQVLDHPPEPRGPYERLLGDALRGDPSLFAREDGVEESWRVVDGVLGAATPVHSYGAGTWGPQEAEALAASEGGWHPLG